MGRYSRTDNLFSEFKNVSKSLRPITSVIKECIPSIGSLELNHF